MPRTPIEYGESDFNLKSNPPDTIGQHTQEILSGLGYSDGEIDSLAKDKIVVAG